MKPINETVTGLVSVIIPTYNRARMVEEAVASVLAQDYSPTEVIVIDDGSTDETEERLKRFGGTIRYFRQENQGQAAARNAGLGFASGEFVASLDSDDQWDADFLSRSVKILKQRELGFVFTNWRVNDRVKGHCRERNSSEIRYLGKHRSHPVGEWFEMSEAETREVFTRHSPAPSSATVLRRDVMTLGWNEATRVSDDWLLMMNVVLEHNVRSAFTDRPMFTKVVHESNIYDNHMDLVRRAECEISDRNTILKAAGDRLDPSEIAAIKKQLAGNYCELGYQQSHARKIDLAFKAYVNAFKTAPSLKSVVGLLKAMARQVLT